MALELLRNQPEEKFVLLTHAANVGIAKGRQGYFYYDRALQIDKIGLPIRIDEIVHKLNTETGSSEVDGYFVLPGDIAVACAKAGDLASTAWWLGYESGFEEYGAIRAQTIEGLEAISINPEELEAYFDKYFYDGLVAASVEFDDARDGFEGKLLFPATAGHIVDNDSH